MPQLSDVQREVITIFKLEHPTWGYKKCCEILPQYFGAIHQSQFDGVVAKLKQEGHEAAKKRKHGSGTVCRIDSSIKASVVDLAVTPEGSPEKVT